MKPYAFVVFETGRIGRYGPLEETGYVTKSITASNARKNKRVRVTASSGRVYYPRREKITTIIPFVA